MVDSVFLFIFVFVFVFVAQMCVWCMCGAVQCSAVGAGGAGGLGVAEVMRLAICRVGDKMANVLVSRTCGFIAWAVVRRWSALAFLLLMY